MTALCECGCGEIAPVGYRGRQLRFINHHNFRGSNQGEKNPAWRDDAGYMAIHNWVRRHKHKSGRCAECGERRWTDFANLSGEYRRDLDDYRELCRPCHRRLDYGKRTVGVQLARALDA